MLGRNIYLRKVNLKGYTTPLMFQDDKESNDIIFYNGSEFWKLKKDKGLEFINKVNKSSYNNYVCCSCFYCLDDYKDKPHKDLKECYDVFCQDAKELKTLTNGKIDLFMTGKATHTALKLFFEFNPELCDNLEGVDYEESLWIENATKGAFIYTEKGYNGNSYKYDINSFYPSLLCNDWYVPICKGEYKKFDNSKVEKLGVGIYRAIITGDINDKFFKINYSNYYTHTDIKRALELKYNVELMQDVEYNSLVYDLKKRVKISSIFKKYIDYLYEFKKNKQGPQVVIKTLLNCLWGALTKKYKHEFFVPDGVIFELYDNKEIVCDMMAEGGMIYTVIDKNNLYDGAIPRLKPFLLSYGRYTLSHYIEPIHNDVIRVHTDSIMTKNKQTKLRISNNLGDWKFEGEKYIEIKNINSK